MDSEIAKLIVCEDHEDSEFFEAVTEDEITGDSRWSKFYRQVWKDTRDGTFWEITWSRGATEYQDQGMEDVEVREVKPVEKTVIVYV
ncbi:hypothetical protein F9K91_24920 [Brucella tritici]|uniref:Uncharacterized protein n=1 Tax=Brucella tritici TaxID=94626 RepID=A0A7X6J9Q4_9HYPH|nr:hypothetical protein [Brucella tritici]KAB2661444.1 hypothetical protein F9K91_24920 [Brucella tritici]NKW09152.1 hypothetical protein [Brucella tritici]